MFLIWHHSYRFNESIVRRDGELAYTRDRLEQLEGERDRLIADTEMLTAGTERDNVRLKLTLDVKEEQLRKLNGEMDRLK